MKWFLDTNICIYFLKGKFPLLQENILLCRPDDIKIPSMVKAELLTGAAKSQYPEQTSSRVNEFLSPFDIVSFDSQSAVEYSLIRSLLEKKGSVIGPNDLVIAATTLARGGVLVTNNEKEFSRVIGLRVENWCHQPVKRL